jgi:hypothetical protein
MDYRVKPEHILRLCQRLSKLLEHCRGTADQVHVFVGRIHVKGMSEKCLELYLVQKLMSRISPIAAISIMSCQCKATKVEQLWN